MNFTLPTYPHDTSMPGQVQPSYKRSYHNEQQLAKYRMQYCPPIIEALSSISDWQLSYSKLSQASWRQQ